ncbi:hypothetical protein [Dermatophilus congolensis]|uniref:hypothetical protein n=1 Tax=Dermatophilus congolensis TaxID=1863 RepID=UPI001AAE673F|nr:hypothetical protein [Dermatophilus congolensis]MBO3142536.1 hypothetical protein [Dermatophilus congolensis]MBO3151526.1 hypothetical protein [Dermatophilus congolensis]MBO3161472.1 hypothetical protein [Dermatophilus congolensis]MBO3162811.1 hypothetical protein [Dermatophilus congolensis]MBO3176365.1 hypothetical protein [Dermatophilus congolensis]
MAVIAIMLPLATALTISAGIATVPLVITCLVLPITAFYFTTGVLYHVHIRLIGAFGFTRTSATISLLLVAVWLFAYSVQISRLLSDMSEDYLSNKTSLHGADLFSYIAIYHGTLTAGSLGIGAILVLAALFIFSAPARIPLARRFLRIPIPVNRGIFWVYVAAATRRAETALITVISYLLAAVLFLEGGMYLAALGVLTVQSIYAYSGSANIRALKNGRIHPLQEFFYLFLSQLLHIWVSALPFLIFCYWRPEDLQVTLIAFLACGSGVLISLYVGILIPMDRENPLAAFIGITVSFVSPLAIFVALAMTGMPIVLQVAAGILAHVVVMYYSIDGIRTLEKSARNA